MADQTAASGFDERTPRLHVKILERVGPVNEVEVDALETHSHDTLLDGVDRVFKMVVASGKF